MVAADGRADASSRVAEVEESDYFCTFDWVVENEWRGHHLSFLYRMMNSVLSRSV